MRLILLLIAFSLSASCFSQALEVQLEQLIKDSLSVKPPASSATTDLNRGTVQLSPQFVNRRTGTSDSDKGESTNGTLWLHYDIGLMAGMHMHKKLKPACKFYVDSSFNGNRMLIGLAEKNGQSELIITI